jgi:hypothetical protein
MIKAGALLYAMFLVLVVSIISSSFVLINYYNNTYVIHALKQEQLFRDANSGINYGLYLHQNIPFNSDLQIDLFEDEQHPITLTKKKWGAFYILTSTANWKNKSAIKSALIGANINNGEQTALYLCDQNKPLSITGNTKIVGDCYLPKSGVKRAYIEGKSFLGNHLINGLKRNSNEALPSINDFLVTENIKELSFLNIEHDSVVDYQEMISKDSILNSFQNKTLVLYSPFTITIANKIIEGNVIIKSDQTILIKNSSHLSNVICYAKAIEVEEKTTGSLQLFANDSINIANECKFIYPSVIALLANKETDETPKIVIGKKVNLKGSIFLYTPKQDSKKKSIVRIGKESQIMGEIYASEDLELNGNVIGGVFCRNFLLKTPSSIYENHLMDITIDRTQLPKEFVGVALTQAINHHQIIQWLN